MYVRTGEGLGQVPASQDCLAETLGEPPIGSAPRMVSKVRRIGTDLLCVEMPAPRLLGKKDNTIYVEIPLGIGETFKTVNKKTKKEESFKVKPCTGIFVPDGYKQQYELNMILYLHGHTSDYPGDGVPIDGYWDGKKHPFFDLRKGVNNSGKNVILVAPTLGPRSQAGALTLWPDAYLDQVMLALMAHGPYKGSSLRPIYANIILACHSGGGSPMRRIALSNNRYTANIRECWGFDCLYGGSSETTEWITWAKSNPTKNLYIRYCDYVDKKNPKKNCTSTKVNSQNLERKRSDEGLENISVKKSTATDHFWVPCSGWLNFIRGATFLPNK
jgi:hypothetical protein